MAWEVLDHTGDLGLEVEAASVEELFGEALAGFTDSLTERQCVRVRRWRRLELSAPALDLLLVDWLQEALFWFETRNEVFRRAEVEISAAGSGEATLRARIGGEPFDPGRHPLKVPIKAVTYHGLEVRHRAGRWRARLIFDI